MEANDKCETADLTYRRRKAERLVQRPEGDFRMRLNLEAPEPFVLRGGSPSHRSQQAIAPDRRSGGLAETTAYSSTSRTCPALPVSQR